MKKRTHLPIALICLFTLAPTGSASTKPVAQRATEIPVGNRVELRLQAHRWTPVKGRLIAVNDGGITLETKENGVKIEKPIAFGEIRSLHDRGNQKLATRVFANIGIAAIIVVGLLVAAFAI